MRTDIWKGIEEEEGFFLRHSVAKTFRNAITVKGQQTSSENLVVPLGM